MSTITNILRSANVHWEGDISRGKGQISVESGLVSAGYSFATRFQNEPGTNPEELLAASHAACFSMALTAQLTRAGHPPSAIDTVAHVHLRPAGQTFDIAQIELETTVRADVDQATFEQAAAAAKDGCPISKALKAVPITLNAKLNP